MRAIWKGAVSFGLVNVPVRLFAATEEHDIRFHQVHRDDGGRIRYKRTCSICAEEVSYDEIAKGYETSDGQLVILTDDDLDKLPVSTGREIDVVEFVPREQVDPILFDKSYYLEPDARAVKPYALLREALVDTDRIAVVKVALRQKETLAVLRVRDKAILLQTMLWPDEIRNPDFATLDGEVDLRPQELSMASSLVESMAADFDPDQFTDDYREAMVALIDAKLERGDAAQLPEEESAGTASSGGEVIDLLTALQRSVDRARAGTATGSTTDSVGRADGAVEAAPATEDRSTEAASAKGVSKARKAPAKKTVKSAPKTASASKAQTPDTRAPAKKVAKKAAAKSA
ncbi:Ku protein [Jatrophihabitans telluris]|uniref:Non-homologous end joining protein Ku n=1 Tax=Jatrophihabitans telluris TaxID=2038343 RepID=A0ABY4R521_9ACTN|nr:Ku protein [Jatrophihabitans telluris]UQX90147.1 Ku protein [Jatrophihabitans telluris]